MKLSPEELADNGYILLDSLDHKELIPFVNTYLKKWTRFSVIYLVSNLILIASIIFCFWQNYGSDNFNFGDGLMYFSIGFLIAFLLIPIHEYIHVLAYKSQGADQTSYDYNLKKFYFMAIADKFVASRKEFQIVALAPVVAITTVLLFLLFFAGNLWIFTILGTLLIHTAFCSGDFGLLSYFDFHKDKEVVTYDDKENGISYFYGKTR
jgi:Putative zincin peptidase